MRNHILRKSLGLIVLYAVIIVGIFVIQFRSDSIIRKTIHSMRVTLVEEEKTSGDVSLKNQFSVSCNGIQFSCDDTTPVEYTFKDKIQKAVLVSADETDHSITLNFKDNIHLNFSLTDESENASLIISGDFPPDISNVSVKMRTLSGFSFTEQKGRQFIIEGKDSAFTLVAPQLEETRLTLLQNSKLARLSKFVKQTEFSLDQINELAGTTKAEWQSAMHTLSSTIISEFARQSSSDASFPINLTEQTVISYVAAMGNSGRYNEALNAVPESFVKGTKRTYQSAPYFGTLAKVEPGLHIQMENYKNMIYNALSSSSCDIFTTEGIAEYIIINSGKAEIIQLMALPATFTDVNFTVLQAAGILKVYSTVQPKDSELAAKLEPVIEPCIKKIVSSCKLENSKLSISENDINLPVISAVTAGDSLIRYGQISGDTTVEKCGYLIVNSYLSDLAGLDLRTLCEIYPLAEHNNPYYPHLAKIRMLEGVPLWTWTIARDIKITQDENRTSYIDIDFPQGLTHYVIISGINPFRRIQIYNIDFRTDPQFEIYNSSGYVYRTNSKSLLLKSRHKSQHEIIKLFYRDLTETPVEESQVE